MAKDVISHIAEDFDNDDSSTIASIEEINDSD
jgi:hypothetical protein